MDPQGVGKLTFFRVYSGRLKAGSSVMNVTSGKRERIGRILRMSAMRREGVHEGFPGDIAARLRLKGPTTRDTPPDQGKPNPLPHIQLPPPAISGPIEPETNAHPHKH